MATKEDFDRIHEIAKRLKTIFARDCFRYESGAEEYIVRAVEEATGHIAPDSPEREGWKFDPLQDTYRIELPPHTDNDG